MEETKKCPKCTEEINKKATKCPKCQADLRNWFSRHPILSIFLALFLIGTFTSSLEDYSDVSTNNTSTVDNLNGIWQTGFYLDEFGDETEQTFISTNQLIQGTFSNTATENSRLNVRILIDNKNEINIKLFEYGSNNPVKAISRENYTVLIKDQDGNKLELSAYNASDRLTINDSSRLHNILLKGGNIQFIIKQNDFPSEYSFSINGDGYSNLVNE